MEYIFFKESSKEWSDLWEFTRKHPINEGVDEPCIAEHEGEVWNYIGTFINKNQAISQLSHGKHPRTNEPYKITYQHESYNEDSIGKRSRIK